MSCLRRLVSLLFSFVDITVVVVSLLYYYKWNLNTINHYLLDFSFTGSLLDLTLLPLLRWSLFSGGFIASIVNPREARERCEKWKTCVLVCAFVQAYYPLIKLLLMSDVSSFVDFSNSPHFLVLISWNVLAPAVFYLQWKSLCVYVVTLRRFVDERQNLLNKENDHHFYGGINSSIDANEENPPINDESSSVDDEDDDSANIEKKKANFYRILAFTKPDWLLMVFATIFLSLAALAEAVLPLYYGKVISLIIIKKDGETLTNNIIWMIIFSLAASGFAGCRGGLMSVINFRTILRIRQAFFDSITSQEIAFFDEMKTGEIMSRLVSDTTNLGSCLGLNINIFLRTTIKILAACGFMFSLSWRMALVTLLGIPLVSAIAKVYGIYYEKLQKEVQDANALSNEVAGEVFASMQTVRSFANEKTEQKRYGLKLHQVYLIKLKQSICYAGFIWSNELLQLLPKVMIMFYGGYLIYNDLLLPESFMSFIIYQQDISQGFIDMASVYTGLMQALGAGDKVFQLIERQPKMKLDDGQVTSSEVKGHIEFDRVSFTYPTRPEEPILKNLSFEACPGEVVALVGPSGGGKSSCVKLLKRFYQPSSGRITLDGVSVHDFQHDYFHRTVTMVGQEPVLFARSISDNIVYGLDDVTTHEIVESARQANAHNFITSLEAKYDTEAGEKGAQLSGGQKQRIAIARALVRHPRVILLDEATSALDTESEFAVQQALEGNRGNRTVLLIAHRLSSVKRADRIIVIMDGCAVETGTHHQLIQKQGVYYHLVKRQSDEATKEVEDISSPAPTCGHLKWPLESDDEPPLAGGMLSTSPTRIFTKPSSPNNHK